MPGRNPREAVEQFLAPLQQAAGVLGTCRLTTSRGARGPRVGDPHSWLLNGGAGLQLRLRNGVPARFEAAMYWKVVSDDEPQYGPFRVTTLGYNYRLVLDDGRELWALHWHPAGRSPAIQPHLHLGPNVVEDVEVSAGGHLPTPRMTFEQSIRWVISFGAAPAHLDWEDRLALAETPHLLFRRWSQDPEAEGRRDP